MTTLTYLKDLDLGSHTIMLTYHIRGRGRQARIDITEAAIEFPRTCGPSESVSIFSLLNELGLLGDLEQEIWDALEAAEVDRAIAVARDAMPPIAESDLSALRAHVFDEPN